MVTNSNREENLNMREEDGRDREAEGMTGLNIAPELISKDNQQTLTLSAALPPPHRLPVPGEMSSLFFKKSRKNSTWVRRSVAQPDVAAGQECGAPHTLVNICASEYCLSSDTNSTDAIAAAKCSAN